MLLLLKKQMKTFVWSMMSKDDFVFIVLQPKKQKFVQKLQKQTQFKIHFLFFSAI